MKKLYKKKKNHLYSKIRYKMSARNGERGIRSILYALYQSPCTIPFSCETQEFEESDGSKTSLTLKDGKVTIKHHKSNESSQTKTQKSSTGNYPNEEEEDKKSFQEEEEKNENNNETDQNEAKKSDDDSFEYVTSAHGEIPQYEYSIFIVDEKVDGECPKDLNSKLMKIYKHVYRSLLNLYDLPLTKLSLHFGVNDKGEIEEEEKNEEEKEAGRLEDKNNQIFDKLTEDKNEESKENKNEEPKEDKKSPDQEGKLENQFNQIANGLVPKDNQDQQNDQTEEKKDISADNNDSNKQEVTEKDNDGKLEQQVNDNVNGLLGSPSKKGKEIDPPRNYVIFLLVDSFCVTSTQTVGAEDDDEDLEGKFGEFFTEEIQIKIDYNRCYLDLPDCGLPNYKAPRSMCILYKAHKKFPNASSARLHDLIQPRFERFDEEDNLKDETNRNSYSTDLNDCEPYTTDSSHFNSREYNNRTKTIIDYDLYNEKRETTRCRTPQQDKKPQKTFKNSQKVDSEDTQKAESEDTQKEQEGPKTSELNDTKVFVCVRCWHLISSINYLSQVQHKELPILHTLPPRPFQAVVQSELYDKRLYPMGLNEKSMKPYSFMICVENSPYKKKVPQARKPPPPPPFQHVKRPSTASSLSSGSNKSQDVFARLLSNTWSTQRNDSNMDRQFKISKGYKRPKTQMTKMIVFPENPSALRNAKKSYSKPPFDINMLNPKRKRKLHPTNGEPEDFSYRISGSSDPSKQMSGRKPGDERPDFVL